MHVAHPHLVLDVSCTSHDHVKLADVHRRDLALFHRLGDGHTDSLGVTSDLATSTATPPDQAVKQPAASATTASAVPALPAACAA